MLLPSFCRASFERAVVVSSASIKSMPHSILKSQFIRHIQVKSILFSITPKDVIKRSFATGASSIAVKRKSTASPEKHIGKNEQKTGATTVKKSTISSGRKTAVKKATKKPPKKLAKAPKKVKKTLSDDQKKTLKYKLLKAQALMIPKLLPRSARTAFMADSLKGYGGAGIKNRFTELSAGWASLTENQKLNFEKKAESNRNANAATMKNWIASHSPDQIRIANNARRTLSKSSLSKRTWTSISDPRIPKRPTTSFMLYMQERHSAGDSQGLEFEERARKHSANFNALSPSERRRYDEMYLMDRKRYIQQYKETFKRDPRIAKNEAT